MARTRLKRRNHNASSPRARLAPTAANRQPIQLIVLHTAGREAEIGRIYRHPWFVQAPLVIAVCAISSQAWVRESDHFNARLIDAAIVADHLILAAANMLDCSF